MKGKVGRAGSRLTAIAMALAVATVIGIALAPRDMRPTPSNYTTPTPTTSVRPTPLVADRAQRGNCTSGNCFVAPAATPTTKPAQHPAAKSGTGRKYRSCSQIVDSIWDGPCPKAPTKAQVQALEHQLLAEWGWSDQFHCLDKIIELESSWRVYDENSIHAYGLPQSLPGDKMASEGADWGYNPKTQLRWMLKYIKRRYGTPCYALNVRQSRNPTWY